MDLQISVTGEGALTRVTVNGQPLGLLHDLSFRARKSGQPELVLRFPPESVLSRSPELAEQRDKYAQLVSGVPWITVESEEEEAAEDSPLSLYMIGVGTDAAGRTQDQVVGKDDSWLERTHDYVQWLLPTRRRSLHEPGAPRLTDADVKAFASRRDMRERFSFVVDRYERFLQLDRMAPFWLRNKDHNHLRMTRMLESMRDLGMHERAGRTLGKIMAVVNANPGRVEPQAVEFWKKAVVV